MKTFRLHLLAAAAMLAFTPAAMADGNTIAVVNIQQIMHDSTAAKSVREQLESKKKAFQADISKKQDALQKESEALKKEQGVLSKSAFSEKYNAFNNKVTAAQKEAQSKEAMLSGAFEGSINDIQKSVTDIITDMSKEKGFILAIPTSQILYSDPKLDISDEVLKRLNQKLPKVDVKFDADAAAAKSSDKSGK